MSKPNKNIKALDNMGGLGEEEVKEEVKNVEEATSNSSTSSLFAEFIDAPKKAEDTHSRATFFLPKDTLKRLNTIAKGKKKGFKSRVVSDGINRILDELEAEMKKR